MRFRRGFTLVEVLIASTVTLVLMAAGYSIVALFSNAFQRVDGHTDCTLQMKRATRNIGRDLKTSLFDATMVTPVAGPGGFEGDAVCMLSASTGIEARDGAATDEDGAPFWQRNIIYYTIRPQGDSCTGGADASGYNDTCPHKVLLRKVIDTPPTTSPMPLGIPLTDSEVLLTDLSPYLTRPVGTKVSAMLTNEADLQCAEAISTSLLSMRVVREPDPAYPGEVQVTLTAFNQQASNKTTNIGSTHLAQHQNLVTQQFSVFPRNNQ